MTPFDEFASSVDYPMTIVTAASSGAVAGCLVGFGTQCSIDPPRFLACVSRANRTCRVATAADGLVVHLPGDDERGRALVDLFGGETGDDVDKFAGVEWSPGPWGAPILHGCPVWFGGPVLDRLDLGDHVGHLLAPTEGSADRGKGFEQIGFQSVRNLDPGHPA